MTDLKPLTNLMVTSVVGWMARYLLRNALRREPTIFEVMYYDCELWLKELSQRQQERMKIYQTIHDLAWG